MSACIFCPTTHPCTDAAHALEATSAIVYKLRGILHGMSMSRDYLTYAEKFEDGMLMAVSDLIDEIDERMTVVDTGYRAVRKQLKNHRDGADETTTPSSIDDDVTMT